MSCRELVVKCKRENRSIFNEDVHKVHQLRPTFWAILYKKKGIAAERLKLGNRVKDRGIIREKARCGIQLRTIEPSRV